MTSKEYTEEEIEKIKTEVAESLSVDRFNLVTSYPFIGGVLMHLGLHPIRDKRMRTAATTGKDIYFDIAFYSNLTPKERLFVLAHETWHVVMMHMLRCQTRIPMLFNIATDMEVNKLITDSFEGESSSSGISKMMEAPADALFPPSNFSGSSAEEYYEQLMSMAQKNGGDPKQKGKSFDEHIYNSGGDGDGSSKKNKKSQDNSPNGKGGKNKNKDGESGKGKDNSNDKNGEGEGEIDEDGLPTVRDKYGKVGYDKDFNPSIQKDIAEQIRETIISEAQRCERRQGDRIPDCIKSLLKKIRKPEINWREMLCQFVTSVYNGQRRWLPPNRRHVHEGLYLQSRRDEAIRIAVAVDTSGSCVGDLPKFMGELVGLVKSFGNYKLYVMYCDTDIQKVEEYDENNEFVFDKKMDIWGGGGTSFCAPFEHVAEKGIDFDCFIYFTDGYGDAPKNPPPYPVMWMLTKDGSDDFVNWGLKVRFKRDASEEDE